MRYILLLIFLNSCILPINTTYKVVTISPCDGYDLYELKSGKHSFWIKDSVNYHQLMDSFKIIKQ